MTAKTISETPAPSGALTLRQPTIGLALGGGGARGLAHVVMLEAFDEMGLKPKVIAGTSIGAIIGAAYASGIPAVAIRAHLEEVLAARFDLVRDVFAARSRSSLPRLTRLFSPMTALLSAEALLEVIYPPEVARDFSELAIPLKIVATDFYGLEQVVFTDGPLRRAVAASMSLPALFEPVLVGDRALIDGGLVNPLPFDLVQDDTDLTVAIDVSGVPVQPPDRRHPTGTEALFAAPFIFERTIIREKLKSQQPDILQQAGTSHFQLLDLWRVKEILAAAEPSKHRLKEKLTRILSAETLPVADLAGEIELIGNETRSERAGTGRPRLLRRLRALRRPKRE